MAGRRETDRSAKLAPENAAVVDMVPRALASRYPRTTSKAGNWLTRIWRLVADWGSDGVDSARHNFAIEHLGQPAGWFKPHMYRYYCVHCRWMFRVENRRGDAIAVGTDDAPLPEPENRLRIATFQAGPCPAASVQALPPLSLAHPVRRSRKRRSTLVSIPVGSNIMTRRRPAPRR